MSKATVNQAIVDGTRRLIAETARHEFGGLHWLKVLLVAESNMLDICAAMKKYVPGPGQHNISYTRQIT